MNATEFVHGLREAADWIEQHADHVDDTYTFPSHNLRLLCYCTDSEEMAREVRILGSGQKEPDDNYFAVVRRFGPIAIQVYTSREKVCRKVTRTEMRAVEVTEWECDPILATATEEVAA